MHPRFKMDSSYRATGRITVSRVLKLDSMIVPQYKTYNVSMSSYVKRQRNKRNAHFDFQRISIM